ncbi:hypothetical protein GWK47_038761 [Chionoecetes opilio]|uniref:Uncharacterized protein n=1 Tax=Chionoecetes opilio TaxID=41210 RepID=A0A8J4YL97_CHIOP|nr:hypothetical protein GWK47_038761 [Chionoecetes opilio]
MFRSHVQMTTREGKGLEEIALFVVLLYSRAWMEAGVATEAAYNDLNLVKDLQPLPGDQRSDREDDPHHILPPISGTSAPISWGCLFLGEDQHGEKKKSAEETRKEKDLDRIRFNKAADQLINSSLPSLTSSTSVRALTLLNKRHLLPFPPCGRGGKQNPAYQKKGVVHSEEPQRHKRRGRAWGGDDFIVQRLPNQG